MYKLIVKYNGYNNNKESGVVDVHEDESEFGVVLNVASYPKYRVLGGRYHKLSFFVEKDGVEKKIDYQKALDSWGDMKLV